MLLRIDELNSLRSDIERYSKDRNKLTDLMVDWLTLAYADGKSDVEDQLRGETDISVERVMNVIFADVGGKTAFERIDDDLDSIEELYLLFGNERQRVYNTAANDTAGNLGAKFKTWHTMLDDRVRETHDYLEGMTKPMNEPFYTYTGDSAMYPQDFGDAANNINCRCYLTYNK